MSKQIDLKKIVKEAGLDVNEVAPQLFPLNAYPRLAFNSVAKGRTFLNAQQISKLSALTGFSIGQLFGEEGDWKSFAKGEIIYFMNGEFKAELNTVTWTTKVFHDKSLFHDDVLHSKMIALSDYVQELNTLITNYKNK